MHRRGPRFFTAERDWSPGARRMGLSLSLQFFSSFFSSIVLFFWSIFLRIAHGRVLRVGKFMYCGISVGGPRVSRIAVVAMPTGSLAGSGSGSSSLLVHILGHCSSVGPCGLCARSPQIVGWIPGVISVNRAVAWRQWLV